jgi:uncharacterized protein (DUF1810 family)
MKPTTAADRMLVASSITSSFDWMLIRDSTRRRKLRDLGACSGSLVVSGSVVVVIEFRTLARNTWSHMAVEKSLSSNGADRFDLQRFVDAQDRVYDTVLAELRAGAKRSHWIWFVFPQLRGLGRSATAARYGISSLEEARAYLTHPVLGPRLRECARLVARIDARSADDIFGWPDNLKVRSSMTLFAWATGDNAEFRAVLDRLYDGQDDPATVELLS